MRILKYFIYIQILLFYISNVQCVSSSEGWRMKDRFSAFRFEIEGSYNRRKLAIAIREKADEYSGFGMLLLYYINEKIFMLNFYMY